MVDHIVDSSSRRGRVDIRTEVGRRRRWSAEEKGRIVAESYAPGAVTSEIARRHEITSQHLFAWRKAAREGRVLLPAETVPAFVPVVTAPPAGTGGAQSDSARAITIEIGGVVVRAEPGVDLRLLRDVLRAVKAAT
jgi:transposase